MIKIKLRREGRKKMPFYRIVVAKDRTKAKGKYLENIGYYNPMTKEFKLVEERLAFWMGRGAQKTDGFVRFNKNVVEKAKENNKV